MLASVVTRIEQEEKELLVKLAKEQDLSVSQVIRRAIREYIAKCQSEK